jgi:hypothetical protein
MGSFSLVIGELRLLEVIISSLGLLLAALVSLYSFHQIKQARAAIPSLSDFIKKGEDGETIIREDVASLIDAFGSRMAQGIKMSFLQGLGAQAKVEKGLKGALAQDIVENKMPLLNLAGDILGFNTKQYIAKHPDALGQLLQLAGPYLGNLNLGGHPPGAPPSRFHGNDGGVSKFG